MELRYISGCTAYNLTINGVEVSELPPYQIVDVIHYLASRCEDKGLLKEMLAMLIEHDKESVRDISHCDQCGDDIYNYKLRLWD